MALTAVMMVAEIVGGTLFGSIALVADGWHMGTHVAALAIAGFAYLFARRHADDPRFSLGTGKFGELAAFSSAIILGMIALGIAYESMLRLVHPVVIHFRDAIPIAALGCASISRAPGCCATSMITACTRHAATITTMATITTTHHHAISAVTAHHDINLRAAYVHVLADALMSILTIAGLSRPGRSAGISWIRWSDWSARW